MTVGQIIAMCVMGLFIIGAYFMYMRNKH